MLKTPWLVLLLSALVSCGGGASSSDSGDVIAPASIAAPVATSASGAGAAPSSGSSAAEDLPVPDEPDPVIGAAPAAAPASGATTSSPGTATPPAAPASTAASTATPATAPPPAVATATPAVGASGPVVTATATPAATPAPVPTPTPASAPSTTSTPAATPTPTTISPPAYAALIQAFRPTATEVTHPQSGLTHPGLFMTKAQLDTMQSHVRQYHEPWATAFAAFAKNGRSSKTPRIYYQPEWTEILRGKANETGNYITVRMAMDSDVAFHQILMWYATGDEVYRLNAMKVLRNYFSIVKVEPHWDSQIRWGIAAHKLCFVADLLKHTEGNTALSRWTETDQSEFARLMNLGKGLVTGTNYWMNQHGFATMGLIGTAVVLDDRPLYDEAVERTTVNVRGQVGGRNGSIKWQMRMVDTDAVTGLRVATPQVQVVEMARDQGHAWLSPGIMSVLAQITYNQGTRVDPVTGVRSTAADAVDVFSFLDHRVLAGTDYITRYSEGESVTWIPVVMHVGNPSQIGPAIVGPPRIGTAGLLYNHYRYVKGMSPTAPAFQAVARADETRMPEADGGTDFPGNGTLLYTPDAGPALKRPAGLRRARDSARLPT